jgi:photosystem II stability/assembly factor-like uncharacterized protein
VGTHLFVAGGQGVILASADSGRTWAREETGTSEYLHGVFAWERAGALEAYAVGGNGLILRRAPDGSWRVVRSEPPGPDGRTLFAVHGDPARGELHAAGRGVLLRSRDGESWESAGVDVVGDLRDLFGDGKGAVYAVGDNGVVLQLAR